MWKRQQESDLKFNKNWYSSKLFTAISHLKFYFQKDNNPNIVEWTLDALRQVVTIKSDVALPYLIPNLTASPTNTKTLSILASAAGKAFNKYLHKIMPALQETLSSSMGKPEEAKVFISEYWLRYSVN